MEENGSAVEIYERLGRIEAKIDDIASIRDMTVKTDRKVEQALAMADSNQEHIRRLENNMKWLFGILVSVVTPLAVIIINFMIGGI